ncbi:MAG: murein L,D-transpeptidase, partial [Bacteroidetes bacterium]|nr:murein L,D-transpeptidase [Bacteroidota bacterium]
MDRRSEMKINKIIGMMLLFAITLTAAGCGGNGDENESKTGRKGLFAGWFGAGLDVEEIDLAMSEELSDSLQMIANLKELELPEKLHDDFKSFYKNRDYQTAWMKKKGVNKAGEDLLKAIEEAPANGLSREDYKLQYLYHLKQKVEKDKDTEISEITKLDKALTAAYLKYASHLLQGRMNPSKIDALWKTVPREMDLAAHLQSALEDGEIAESLQQLDPQDPQYAALKNAYNNYKHLLEENGEWPKLPAELTIKAGDSTKYVATLRKRLEADGYFKSPKPDSLLQVYD